MDKKNENKNSRGGCSCAGCLGMLLFFLSAIGAGYVLREWEGQDWDRARTAAVLRQKITARFDNLRGRLTSTPPADRTDAEPDTEPEEIPATWGTKGDEAYARARQVWFKANNAAGAERQRLRSAVERELSEAARCYETAYREAADATMRASLLEKLQTTKKSLTEMQKKR